MGAVSVYTVCDESRYMVVRNVPALGCRDDLVNLFTTYGEVEACKPMDAEDCEEITDVFWLKLRLISNARFANRKLDELAFLGNRLQVSYAPEFESFNDTEDKLETRRTEVLSRTNPARTPPKSQNRTISPHKGRNDCLRGPSFVSNKCIITDSMSLQRDVEYQFHRRNAPIT